MSGEGTKVAPAARRLDQWLWFARFVKSRSLAARLCADGEISVNGNAVDRPRHLVRVGDAIAIPQGRWCRTVRVLALGRRRGPAQEARLLYEEATAPTPRFPTAASDWAPLLDGGPAGDVGEDRSA